MRARRFAVVALAAMLAVWDLLYSPACAAALQDAKNAATAWRRLDALHQQALAFATRSYCP
ncbi:hypothetical protein [Mycobacterium sp.]|uniref:hypothetical protein n=1 Tax=Mycobacterium sp. TaxID=1785 RepID=UPI002C8F7453|nr:hypothetical protein [Mycobacterium sp.]HME48846.1 hypothetical protein [Mycobacterium sp.]